MAEIGACIDVRQLLKLPEFAGSAAAAHARASLAFSRIQVTKSLFIQLLDTLLNRFRLVSSYLSVTLLTLCTTKPNQSVLYEIQNGSITYVCRFGVLAAPALVGAKGERGM